MVRQLRNGRVHALATVMALGLLVLTGCTGAPGDSPYGSASVTDAPSPIFDFPEGLAVQLVEDPAQLGDLVMQDLDGRSIAMSDLRGKVTLVNFWATWCGPCRQEIPDLIRLQDQYPDQLQIIGVSLDESGPATVRAFAEEFQMNYPVVMTTAEIAQRFPRVFALPTTFVIDPVGQVAQTHVGLVHPAIMEQETRILAGLPTDVNVELIADTQQTLLADAAHATEIPGVDLSVLTAAQKEAALQRLNEDECVCGCALTLAQCRINDPACDVSLPLAQTVVAEIVAASE